MAIPAGLAELLYPQALNVRLPEVQVKPATKYRVRAPLGQVVADDGFIDLLCPAATGLCVRLLENIFGWLPAFGSTKSCDSSSRFRSCLSPEKSARPRVSAEWRPVLSALPAERRKVLTIKATNATKSRS